MPLRLRLPPRDPETDQVLFAAFNFRDEARTYTFDFAASDRVQTFLGHRRYGLTPRIGSGASRQLEGGQARLPLSAQGFEVYEPVSLTVAE